MVVPRPAGEGDAAEEAAPLDRHATLRPRMRLHDVHPGGVVGGVALEVGQEEPLAEGALERARRPRVPEDGEVLPPEARVDLVYVLRSEGIWVLIKNVADNIKHNF